MAREAARTVFLFDVDNTLLENDRVTEDLSHHIERVFGVEARERYFAILEQLRAELGYTDYLGALQRYRVQHPRDIRLLGLSTYILDYPFRARLYPGALDVLARCGERGVTAILSDGDVVFQPHKVHRSGLYDAVHGQVLIYIHKEQMLGDVEQRFPADHYVVIDDKPRICAAVKQGWGSRVTTIMPRQGHYAHDAEALKTYAPADIIIESIGDMLKLDLDHFSSL